MEKYYWIKSNGNIEEITKTKYEYYKEIYEDGVIEGEHVRLVLKKTNKSLFIPSVDYPTCLPIKALNKILGLR